MKKRILGLLLTLLMILSLVPVGTGAAEDAWMSFYVSPTGSDSASGTQSAPFKTLARAQEEVRKHNKNMQGDIVVNLMPGRYETMKHLVFTVEDSATNGFEIIWQGTDKNNLPTVSGGKEVIGTWTEGENGIWQVKAENFDFVREMFVNDRVATRARSAKKVWGTGLYTEAAKWIHPHFGEQSTNYLGYCFDKTKMGLYENPEDVELHAIMKFRTALLRVDDIVQHPDHENQVVVMIDKQMFNEYNVGMSSGVQVNYNHAFVVENAFELLDEPGEFYFNKKTKVLYYIPREGENLNNAEVIIPVNEQLVFVSGNNEKDLVKGITFQNIRFAHATNYELEDNSITGGQAEYHYSTYTPYRTGRAAILLDWADNVNIESCVLFGLTGKGIHIRNGVFNSRYDGNVFADLGSDGVDVSVSNHDDDIYTVDYEGPYDVAWHAPWASSYHYWPASAYNYGALNTQRQRQEDMAKGSGWYSNPLGSDSPEWVMLELEREYDLESFEFSFPKTATSEQRSNFEVQISNDRKFGDYKTIATFTEPAELTEKIAVDGTERYRYIRLIKTDNGPFCLNAVWAWSNEGAPSGSMAPRELSISNNYFTRVSQHKQGSYPIMLNYGNNIDVLHNHIEDAPYAGITVGWGWYSPNSSCYDNNISKNKIEDVMQYMDDGAGIYILGPQPGTKVEENLIRNTVHDGMALYFDQGTTGVTANGNVSYGTKTWMNMNIRNNYGAATCLDNEVMNAYTGDNVKFNLMGVDATDQLTKDGMVTLSHVGLGSLTLYMDVPTQFNITNPPDEVARIMAESGLEENWEWIMERVPEEDVQRTILYGEDSSDARQLLSAGLTANLRIEADVDIAKSMLANGSFGNLPWQYDPATKVEMEYWIASTEYADDRADDSTKIHLEEQYNLQRAIRAANDSVYHPSFDEMLTMCEDLAKDTANYTATDIAAFNKKVAEIRATNPETKGEKGVAANQLRVAYMDLYSKTKNPEVMAVVVRGGKSEVDAANKKVTVTLPYDMDYSEIGAPFVAVTPGSKLAVDSKEINFAKGKGILPIYNEAHRTYSFWNVEFVHGDKEGTTGAIDIAPENWTTGNMNVQKTIIDGALTIEPWYQPTMNKVLTANEISFALNVPRADTLDGIGMIFGAQTTDLVYNGFESKNTYYMLKLVDQNLTLYKVKDGVATACMTAEDIYFNYGEFNPFTITVTEEHDLNRVTVKIENDVILDTLVDEPISKTGYFGILSKHMAVKVK
ncbi:MAG: hypothetical protein E7418_00125 [Ruminococcaceae bacterium]|nr:hypothetical protein [Oscillospiraceae bacterium]